MVRQTHKNEVTALWDSLRVWKAWYVFLAVHQVSWGISVKWMLTNVAQLPATTVPFAKILLIATSATAGQVSHSNIMIVPQFRNLFELRQHNSILQETSQLKAASSYSVLYMVEFSLPYYVNHLNTCRTPILDLAWTIYVSGKVTLMPVVSLSQSLSKVIYRSPGKNL